MKSISEYLQLLAGYMKANAANYHITRMGIFGSVARGEETEVSDIDICFEGEAPTLFTLARSCWDDLWTWFVCGIEWMKF